jgi:hypothetical protein
MAPPTRVVDHSGTAKYPEPLCPFEVLPHQGWHPVPSRRALPPLLRSYGLMRQTKTLPPPSGIDRTVGGSLQVAASPCWVMVLPDVISASLSQDAWAQIPAGRRVLSPVSSPTSSAFPKSRQWVGFPHRSAERLHSGRCFEIVAIPYVQASWFARHPGLPYRCGPMSRRAAVTFSSEQNTCRYLHMHRIS